MNLRGRKRLAMAGVVAGAAVLAPLAVVAQSADELPGSYDVNALPMAYGLDGWTTESIFTVGETIGEYTPPGILDGLGAYEKDGETVRVLANHELLNFRSYEYQVNDGSGGTFGMKGARISYFDIDKDSREVVGSGLAYDTVYDANGDIATDIGFLANDLIGFSRFCSGSLFEAHQFGRGRGLEDRIYFAGEEDGSFFSPVGGAEWALDPATGTIWQLPDLGRGAWENVTVVNTGRKDTVAILLADDSPPFDADPDAANDDEAAPLFLYVGKKDPTGDFPARNGLRGGKLYVWVAENGVTTPTDFNSHGTLHGHWIEVDNSPTGPPSEDGSTGYDEYGYPTQSNLWVQARELGGFGFSRPEDIATNPRNGRQAVLASTGVDTYEGGVDTFGTMYKITMDFRDLGADIEIIYDGDADPNRTLRSPDNLDWADDGRIYVQEDEAEEDTLDGEPLFGAGAANPNEAGVIRMRPNGHKLERIANINRGVTLDASLPNPTQAFDGDFGNAGEWESSGIVDVSTLFGERKGTLFLFNVQAHGIEDQEVINGASRISDGDLREGGQLLFLENTKR